MLPEFNSLPELSQVFHSEEVCLQYLEEIRWKGKVVSPYDTDSKVYHCKNHRFYCKNTNRYFNAKTGLMFENSKVSLQKWFIAIFLLTTNKKGISSLSLSRHIGVSQKTAWFMLHRIRESFKETEDEKLECVVEIDETFVGGKNKNRHWDKKVKQCQGRSYKDKTPVFGMLQRGGKVVARVVSNTKAKTLQKEIFSTISKGSCIYTDEWSYGNLSKYYTHHFIRHNHKQYADGDVSTNHIENFWSIVKRGIIGIYHYTSRKHLQRYVNEFALRYNTRFISDYERFNVILCSQDSKITYTHLTG